MASTTMLELDAPLVGAGASEQDAPPSAVVVAFVVALAVDDIYIGGHGFEPNRCPSSL